MGQKKYGGPGNPLKIIDTPDGIYRVQTFSRETMRAEKINGTWYWTDGTGWKEQVQNPEEIIIATDISDLPEIKPDFDYGALTYPLNEFFVDRKKEERGR